VLLHYFAKSENPVNLIWKSNIFVFQKQSLPLFIIFSQTAVVCNKIFSKEYLWSPYVIGQTIIFLACGFYLSFFFFFSSPNLSSQRLDVYHTSTHSVALVRISRMHVWNVLHAACWKYRTQKIAILAPSDNFVGLYLRSWGMYRQSDKNFSSSNMSSTRPHNMVNFGLLIAEICWRVWGTPANFNGFRVLAALLHGTLIVSPWRKLWSCGAQFLRTFRLFARNRNFSQILPWCTIFRKFATLRSAIFRRVHKFCNLCAKMFTFSR